MDRRFWLQPGYFIDSDIPAHFAMCHTNDGKLSCWGYKPDDMTFQQAVEKLKLECLRRGLEILHPRQGRQSFYTPVKI